MHSVVVHASGDKGGGSSPARLSAPVVNYANPGTYVPPAKPGYVNYAQVGKPRGTHKRAWTVAAGACAVLAVASIGLGVREFCTPAIEGARLHEMSRVENSDNAPANDTSEGTSEQTDWNALYDINEDVRAWLTVGGTDIDYAVCQAEDNDWYLHHDVYGTPDSLCGVFADYRCTVGGANTLIYGHTVSTGGMFAPISDVYHPGAAEFQKGAQRLGHASLPLIPGIEAVAHLGHAVPRDIFIVDGADGMVANANKVLALVCCSADTNTRRSVLVCVC